MVQYEITERRMDLSGFGHGSVQPKDHRVCLWHIYDGGTGD